MTDTITFTGTVYWCHIHETTRMMQNDTPLYGLCVAFAVAGNGFGFLRKISN